VYAGKRPSSRESVGDASRGERTDTPRGISLASRRLDMALAQMHASLSQCMDVTAQELLAIDHLDMDGAMGPSDLARRLHMTTGAMTALADRLDERGYVAREAHPSDRRRLVLSLTQKARAAARLHVLPMAHEVESLAAELSEDQRQTVGVFLDGLAAIAQRYAAPVAPDSR
jgi:DNA-binding MarR family transcriptional regulator